MTETYSTLPRIHRLTQISLYLLAICSSLMLAISISSWFLFVVAIGGALGGFVLTDSWKICHLRGWVANFVSILILFLAMKDFFPADSAGKLVSVAHLLVYLQTVLMFQEKTPRLNWQIMVLTLLQLVITTIFTVTFESGFLFLAYFILAGVSLILQNLYTGTVEVEQVNRRSAWKAKRESAFAVLRPEESADRSAARESNPSIAGFGSVDLPPTMASRCAWMLIGIMGASILFTSVLFFLAPRRAQAWFNPIVYEVAATGTSRSIDLNDSELIRLSKKKVFEVTIEDAGTRVPVRLISPAYFRGIAMSSLVIKNDQTSWTAPWQRVNNEMFQSLPFAPVISSSRVADLTISMAATTDPVTFCMTPILANSDSPSSMRFCHEISAVLRGSNFETIKVAPYSFTISTQVSPRGDPLTSWPYVANTREYRLQPMSKDPAQHRWLTQMDPERYPTLVSIARDIDQQVQQANGSRMEVVRRMENYLLDPTRFRYTLDYRNVPRLDGVDPVEDFVANHHAGHCELYASALTLMLRSIDIPARVVTGFHGGDFDAERSCYIVRQNHAHAWVEVYLRVEDCTPEMQQNGSAGPGGAWLIADATPSQSVDNSQLGTEGAIELARSVWQDYVLGMDSQTGDNSSETLAQPIASLLSEISLSSIKQIPEHLRQLAMRPMTQAWLTIALGIGMMYPLLLYLIHNAGYREPRPATTAGKIKRFIADAIGLFSPELREWVIGQDPKTEFYRRFLKIMEQQGIIRSNHETHREFADKVSARFRSHRRADQIAAVANDLTAAFNQIRFGNRGLESEQRTSLESRVSELKMLLADGAD